MSGNFPVGSRVKLHTKFQGMYYGKLGTVIENPAKVSWSNDFSWIRVKFDDPVVLGEKEIKDDIFHVDNLIHVEEI